MKILHLIPYYVRATNTGGPALQVSLLVHGLQSCGAQVRVVTTTGNLDEEIDLAFASDIYETQENGIPVVYLRRKSGFLPPTYYYAPGLSGWLKNHLAEFDLAIIHGTWTYFDISARICRKMGIPYLCFVHGSFDPWALKHHRFKKLPYWSLMEKSNFKKSNGVIVLSRDEAAQVLALGIEKPTYLARNGLLFPLSHLDEPKAVLFHRWPELDGHPYVYFMSRLHPKKGIEVLLKAWGQVYSTHPEWRLVIAGPDEAGYLATLLALASSLGLQGTVLFPGLVKGDLKTAYFQNASLFVLPSFSEGVPGVVVEAMGYGLPVLITPGCHMSEVAPAQAGLIVEPQPQAMAAGLERLMSDAALRQQMGGNAEQLARTEFDEMKVAAGLVEFCHSILKSS